MNRPALIVDASVAVKWFLNEPGTAQALAIEELYRNEALDVLAPSLIVPEVQNVFWKRVRRGEMSACQAQRCADQFLLECPILVDSAPVHRSALELALAHGHPVYDCLYLALALDCRCDLVTADERFFAAMRRAYPCLRLLADYKLASPS